MSETGTPYQRGVWTTTVRFIDSLTRKALAYGLGKDSLQYNLDMYATILADESPTEGDPDKTYNDAVIETFELMLLPRLQDYYKAGGHPDRLKFMLDLEWELTGV